MGGSLVISGAIFLNSLTGLEGLTAIGGSIEIGGNDALTSFAGLDNLNTIGGNLYIEENDTLSSLSGLDNIQAETINNLIIYGNSSLSTCEVYSVCIYLANPNGTIDISNNAQGCNSQQEVEEACLGVTVNEIESMCQLSISPNPVNENATVALGPIFIGSINIYLYNTSGICLKSWQYHSNQSRQKEFQINLKEVPAGMYFLQVKAGNEMVTKKMIKL